MTPEIVNQVAKRFVEFLETGRPPADLFHPEVFLDFTSPLWRMQALGLDGVVAIRLRGHPQPGLVPRWRAAPTPDGMVTEFEERWDEGGQRWYCREMAWLQVDASARVTSMSVYCTGDWDEARQAAHAREVTLLRP